MRGGDFRDGKISSGRVSRQHVWKRRREEDEARNNLGCHQIYGDGGGALMEVEVG